MSRATGVRVRTIAAAMAVMAMVMTAAAPATACQLAKAGELKVVMDGNQPLVEVEGNGEKLWALLDSGASSSVLFHGAAIDLNMKVERVAGLRFVGVGGSRQAGMVRFNSFALGGSRLDNVRMLLITGMKWTGKRRVVMLLGQDLLGKLDVEYDLKNGIVRLFQPRNCGKQPLLYWADSWNEVPIRSDPGQGDVIISPVTLNGVRNDALLDTGANTSVVTPAVAARAGVDFAKLEGGAVSSGIGARRVKTREGVFDTFQFGDEVIRKARIDVAALFNQATNGGRDLGTRIARTQDVMLLGADWFRAHRVLVSNSQKKVYFTYEGGPVFQHVGPGMEDDLDVDDEAKAGGEVGGAAAKPPADTPASAPSPTPKGG